jgi:Ca2+-binding RTX toxin-like protein
MATLLPTINFDLLKINLALDHDQFLTQLPSLLYNLDQSLDTYSSTDFILNVPSIQTSYHVIYGASAAFNVIDLSASTDNNIVLGGDAGNVIVGGSGDDIIFGGAGSDVLMGLTGDNILVAGSGATQMAGLAAFQAVNVSFPSGVDSVTIDASIPYSNVLVGGSGTDIMAGVALSVAGVFDLTGTHGPVFTLTATAEIAGNTLFAGSGNGTQVFGAYGEILEVTVQNFTGVLHQIINITIDGSTIYGGSGQNELLVGTQGTYNIAHGIPIHYDLVETWHANSIYAGSGNSTLIGSTDLLSNVNPFIQSLDGIASKQVYTIGDNVLVGGAGTDALIGDIRTLNVEIPAGQSDVINFGNSTLIAGTGDTTMVGDVEFLDPLNSAILNYGNDTFQFNLSQHLGADKILDMNAGGVMDTLSFTGAGANGTGAAAVDANIHSFTNDGTGHLLVTFNNGGSIDFANVVFVGQHSIADITPHIIVHP